MFLKFLGIVPLTHLRFSSKSLDYSITNVSLHYRGSTTALVEVAGRSTSDTPITGMRERDRAGRTAATGGTHAPTLASETPR